MKTATVFVLSLVVAMSMGGMAWAFSDDFEDGIISNSLWLVGGGARGTWATDPIGTGAWDYSLQEVMDPTDGYLSARVWGPTSGNTFGAEAWIRTTYDFNNGTPHLINFRWGANADGHYDSYYIQITDGYIPAQGDVHWPMRRPPLAPITPADLAGTSDLLWSMHPWPAWQPGWMLEQGMVPTDMSIVIDPGGIARLYTAPDAAGSLLYETPLDASKPWYIRFMVSDATSGGFPAGDARLNLYGFSAEAISETIDARIDIDPDVLNLHSAGKYITCHVTLPESYNVSDVDPATILLNGQFAPAWKMIDERENTLQVKFSRSTIQTLLPPGEAGLTVTGQLTDGTCFAGADTIRVIDPTKP